MFVTLSLSNTSRALQLRLRPRELRPRDALATHATRALRAAADSTAASERAFGRRRRDACRETAARSAAARPTPHDARPRSTSARYSRALRCGGGTRKLDQRFSPFAPVRTASSTSSGKNPGSVTAGRVVARPSGMRSCPALRIVTRRSPVCSGSTVRTRPARRPPGSRRSNARPAAASRRCPRRRR